MKNTLKINNDTRTIIMDREFSKKSSIVGTKEYEMLQTARRDYPLYTVKRKEIKKNPNKESYRGLTYVYMEEYINTHAGAEKMMREFKELILLSKCHSIRYPQIKKWFLQNYPEVANYSNNTTYQVHEIYKKVAQETKALSIKQEALFHYYQIFVLLFRI